MARKRRHAISPTAIPQADEPKPQAEAASVRRSRRSTATKPVTYRDQLYESEEEQEIKVSVDAWVVLVIQLILVFCLPKAEHKSPYIDNSVEVGSARKAVSDEPINDLFTRFLCVDGFFF